MALLPPPSLLSLPGFSLMLFPTASQFSATFSIVLHLHPWLRCPDTLHCPLLFLIVPSTLPQCTSCPLLSPRLLSCPLSPLLHLRVPLIVPSPCLPPPPRGLPWPRGTSAPLPSRGWKQGCSQPSEENSVSSGLGSSHRGSPARNIPSGDGGCCRRPAGPTQTLRTRHCPFKQPAALIG